MEQLVYLSSQSWEMRDDDLVQLLAQSRANNQRLGVTGMLLHGDHLFLQVLEGEAAVVARLYEKIQADERNRGCRTIWQKTIAQREFGGWRMASAAVSNGQLQAMPGFSDFMGENGSMLSSEFAGAAHFMLRSFRDLHGKGK